MRIEAEIVCIARLGTASIINCTSNCREPEIKAFIGANYSSRTAYDTVWGFQPGDSSSADTKSEPHTLAYNELALSVRDETRCV